MSAEEYSRRVREGFRRLDEVTEAARSAARGMGRAEARRQIVAELRARGIVMPPPGVDLILHEVMLGSGVAGGMRRAVWHLGNAAGLAARVAGLISAVARHQPLPGWDFGGGRFLLPDPRVPPEVILDPGAGEWLAIGDGDVMGDVTFVDVWLGCPGPGRDPAADAGGAGGEPVAAGDEFLVVYYGEERVGVWDRKPVTLTARPSVRPTMRASCR